MASNNDDYYGCIFFIIITLFFTVVTISDTWFPHGSFLAEFWMARFVVALLVLFVIVLIIFGIMAFMFPGITKRKRRIRNVEDDDTITFSANVKIEEVKKDTAEQKQPIVIGSKLSEDQYYKMCKEQAMSIYTFIESLENDKEFCSNLAEHVEGAESFDSLMDFKNHNNRIVGLMLVDMLKCYKMLGHGLSEKSREFLCLNLLVSRLFWGNEDFDASYVDENSSTAELTAQICKAYSMITSPKIDDDRYGFLFAVILQTFAGDKLKEYMVLLYRLSSIVAKADGNITAKESEWLSGLLKASPEESQPAESVVSHSGELDDLIGLGVVKAEVKKLTNFIKIQQERTRQGLKAIPISYHCVFTGNPGTGKTTVARIIASIYKDLGILAKGHLVETDRSGLVAEYVGQTSVKTNKIIDSALDGVLFIDEAYSLVAGGNNDYGSEAISTLLKRMEDDRARLVVILAGYGSEMKQFIDSNPGLQSRFNRYIHFDDYNEVELIEIFKSYVKKHDYVLEDEANKVLKARIAKAVAEKDKNFGNARFVRNLFEKTLEMQATRLASEDTLTKDALQLITAADIAKC